MEIVAHIHFLVQTDRATEFFYASPFVTPNLISTPYHSTLPCLDFQTHLTSHIEQLHFMIVHDEN